MFFRTINIQNNEIRPYQLLQPFEKENVTPVNTVVPINFVQALSSDSSTIDIGDLGL
jgi:hypothetical protein